LARRNRGRPISGWLNLDKPAGMTSTQAVGAVRRLLDAQKVGHGGTLDPLATGVLPIALGEATKTVAYVMDGEKEYEFTIRWGEERDTDDAEGAVVAASDKRPSRAEVAAALPAFIGEISQLPPAFSALKVAGERAYDIARRGDEVALHPRTVTVRAFAPAKGALDDANHMTFQVVCGKGTYVRALARDLARALGTVGHVAALRRTRVGPFRSEAAISLDRLADLVHSAPLDSVLLPVKTALDDIPALAITGGEAERLKAGQPLRVPSRKQGIVQVRSGDALIALGEVDGGLLRPLRVFNI
jgi:tRNA pseudouridine55 synthase